MFDLIDLGGKIYCLEWLQIYHLYNYIEYRLYIYKISCDNKYNYIFLFISVSTLNVEFKLLF